MHYLETMLITEYSKAPKETSLYEAYKNIGVALEIDLGTHKTINIDIAFIGNFLKDF